MRRSKNFRGKKSGFTLVEILLVLALLSLLIGFGVANADKLFGSNQNAIVSMKVKESFNAPLFKYRADTGRYPTTDQGIKALLVKPSDDKGRWRGPYITKAEDLVDPWGNELKYRYPGTKNVGGYDLYSLGEDGKDGTADDIGNWE
ncbi:type II secretion system major pseudopilin GspG [Pelagicoccus mobilis]|uniref:Type II secretion system major pseudopilin GspG n=1 Tax=Pelagicoccus mobilis TaxID=415221 RepID=A0A934RWF4_9BACT|nr:type II secretion system major pseudopilin GspG [Pelagicoccus mobilis]MBK1878057.1 type II secretion system major pseudopilin GspG [Pelagicoccus mobilis]